MRTAGVGRRGKGEKLRGPKIPQKKKNPSSTFVMALEVVLPNIFKLLLDFLSRARGKQEQNRSPNLQKRKRSQEKAASPTNPSLLPAHTSGMAEAGGGFPVML